MRYFLENALLKVEIDSLGAEVKSVMSKSENREYMWYGNPKYWGRTSPVLFPFVGSLRDHAFTWQGRKWPIGQHGFARDLEFTVTEQAGTAIRFRLESTPETLQKYPFPFVLEITYTLEAAELKVSWTVLNPGSTELHFSIGAHPGFLCPIHGERSKAGYRLVFDGCTEIRHYGNDRESGLALHEDLSLVLQDHKAVISEDFFDRCTYIVNGQCGSVGIEDPAGRRYVTVKFDAPLFGIWSPEEQNAPFICIEPWYGRCDTVDFTGTLDAREFGNRLAPGDSWQAGYSILYS